jgi:hypothetical protein
MKERPFIPFLGNQKWSLLYSIIDWLSSSKEHCLRGRYPNFPFYLFVKVSIMGTGTIEKRLSSIIYSSKFLSYIDGQQNSKAVSLQNNFDVAYGANLIYNLWHGVNISVYQNGV